MFILTLMREPCRIRIKQLAIGEYNDVQSSMPGRGSVSTVEERRQCITIVYDDLL